MHRRPIDRLLERPQPIPINPNQLKFELYFQWTGQPWVKPGHDERVCGAAQQRLATICPRAFPVAKRRAEQRGRRL